MADEALTEGRGTRRPTQGEAPAVPAAPTEDALEALRAIVFGSRLDAVDELRERVERAEGLRSLLERLEARTEQAQVDSARVLAARAEVAQELARRLEAAEVYARQIEADASQALAEREAADDALAERVEAVERLARGVEGLAELDRRVQVVEAVRERVVQEDLRAEDVSAILPRAVAMRSHRDGQLAAALRPTIADTLLATARKNPQALVDIIFPVLGPAIRKMITTAVAATVGSINRAVESSFTLRGLKWRLQAWRTKRSYAEIALMHGLVYRVEQLFLIQRGSGLLLAHAVRNPSEANEPEAVSGMLTAITDFVRDSFKVESGSEVETFRVGDLTLIVKGGPKAVLAATVRGIAPPDLHDALSTAIEQVHRDYGQAIDAFDGDMASLAGVEALLEPNLVEEQKQRTKKSGPTSLVFWVLLAVALATIAASWITNGLRAARVERDVRALGRTLNAEEGIVVTGMHEDGDRWVVEGLRDPLATEPAAVLERSGLDEGDVTLRLRAYRSLEPPFVQRRASARLYIPATVQATWKERILVLAGRASAGWLDDVRKRVRDMDGVEGLDIEGLGIDPALDTIESLRARMAGTALRVGDDLDAGLLQNLSDVLAAARAQAGRQYEVGLVVVALVRRLVDEPAARAYLAQAVERLGKAGIESTSQFLGPRELARPVPGQWLPTRTESHVQFDLVVTPAEDAPR